MIAATATSAITMMMMIAVKTMTTAMSKNFIILKCVIHVVCLNYMVREVQSKTQLYIHG